MVSSLQVIFLPHRHPQLNPFKHNLHRALFYWKWNGLHNADDAIMESTRMSFFQLPSSNHYRRHLSFLLLRENIFAQTKMLQTSIIVFCFCCVWSRLVWNLIYLYTIFGCLHSMAPSREKRKNEHGYISKLLRQVQQHISAVYMYRHYTRHITKLCTK